jgi:adenylate cyclase class 2
MLEVEMKFPVADFTRLAGQLRQWGAQADEPIQEADHYCNAPDRDFAQTDEALRLRRIGAQNRVTYKGPRLDRQTKTRTEIEVGLADGDRAADDFLRLLGHLGYRPSLVVCKRRQIHRLERGGFHLEVCLDEVDGLGRYVELEVLAEPEQLDAARSLLLRTAADLGLAESERRSYLEMLLASGST